VGPQAKRDSGSRASASASSEGLMADPTARLQARPHRDARSLEW